MAPVDLGSLRKVQSLRDTNGSNRILARKARSASSCSNRLAQEFERVPQDPLPSMSSGPFSFPSLVVSHMTIDEKETNRACVGDEKLN
jgi:hypothetical protein